MLGAQHAMNMLTGDRGNNVLLGGTLDDVLVGDRGNDALSGNAGDDELDGGDGDDSLTGGYGADDLTGGDGDDTAVYGGSMMGVTVRLHSQTVMGGDAEGDTWGDLVTVEYTNPDPDAPARREGFGGNRSRYHQPGWFQIMPMFWRVTAEITSSAADMVMISCTVAPAVVRILCQADTVTTCSSAASAADILHGGAGDDLLSGGAGIATASYGGSGSDMIYATVR